MEGESFDWLPFLRKNNFEAASVSLMKHAPGSETWKEAVSVGMKLELRIHDIKICPKKFISPNGHPPFWIATVIKVQGYYLLVRYEGMENNSSKDFWIHLGLYDAHPVGGETHSGVLIPPKFVLGKTKDWRNYVISSLCGIRTLPTCFITLMKNAALYSKYRVGDQLEVVDKYKISQLREARVNKITGQRLYLHYTDTDNDGFFCHENSSIIHAPGWATLIGHNILKSNNCKNKCGITPSGDTGVTPANEATIVVNGEELKLSVGMKLEAVDPLCPGRICAASVCKLLEYGNMMIKIESYSNLMDIAASESTTERKETDDWFCYNIESPYIFECGFCEDHDIPLAPPFGYQAESFQWITYLQTTGTRAAPIPSKPPTNHGFKEGMKVEMADLMTPVKIHVATVFQVAGRLLRIRFDGWGQEWDQWLDIHSVDIYPVGYCALVGHLLQLPETQKRPKRTRTARDSPNLKIAKKSKS